MSQISRVFLAAPYSQWMNPETGLVARERRDQLDGLRRAMISQGYRVFSAQHNEKWGGGWLPADECTPADFSAMKAADVVVAILGSPASGGVTVELGWASAMSKPIVVIRSEDVDYSPLIVGLQSITRTIYVSEPRAWDDFFRNRVMKCVQDLIQDQDSLLPLDIGMRADDFLGADAN